MTVTAADVPLDSEEPGAQTESSTGVLAGKTAWARNLEAPLRDFLRTETGSAAILLVGVVSALIWVNASPSSYNHTWATTLSIQLGHSGISQDLRHWVNNGLM